MKKFHRFSLFIILFYNQTIVTSNRKHVSTEQNVSQNPHDYIDGHFIYKQSLNIHHRNKLPDINGIEIFCTSKNLRSKIQEEYKKAQEISPEKAFQYLKILKKDGFLRAKKTHFPNNLMISTSDENSLTSSATTFLTISRSNFSDTASNASSIYQIKTAHDTSHIDRQREEDSLKAGFVFSGVASVFCRHQTNEGSEYRLFPPDHNHQRANQESFIKLAKRLQNGQKFGTISSCIENLLQQNR